jgi:predicted HD phosphohydrolase
MQNENNSMGGYGVNSHEKVGADYLREKGFPEKVAKLVENHVQAKRYLTFKYPEYYDSLSDASKKTLEFQGGVMSATEAESFENDILFETSIRMRKWDELAKEINVSLVNLEEIKFRARMVLSQ